MDAEKVVAEHYGKPDLENAILAGVAAVGLDPDHFEPDDLAAVDQFHIGGAEAAEDVARGLEQDRITFVDTRPVDEVHAGTVPGSINIPAPGKMAAYGGWAYDPDAPTTASSWRSRPSASWMQASAIPWTAIRTEFGAAWRRKPLDETPASRTSRSISAASSPFRSRSKRGKSVRIDAFSRPGSFYRGNLHTHSLRSDGARTARREPVRGDAGVRSSPAGHTGK